MTNLTPYVSSVTMGDGTITSSTHIGTYRTKSIQKDGTSENITLSNVLVVPSFSFNLFSVPCALQKGAKLGNDNECITVEVGSTKITFDNKLKCGKSMLLGVKFKD
jgi:hypothetical protein